MLTLHYIPPTAPWAIVEGQGEGFLLSVQKQDTKPTPPKMASTS